MGFVELLILGIGSIVVCVATFDLVVSQYEKFKEDKSFALTVIDEIGLTINQFIVINFATIFLGALAGMFIFEFITRGMN